MIIIEMAGGLGNQLQQYALYQKFVRLGVEARLDISWFSDNDRQQDVYAGRQLELNYLDRLIYEACTEEEKQGLIGSDSFTGKLRRKLMPSSIHWFKESKGYHPEILTFHDMYISGYFACERYYSDILYDLRQKIQFPESRNPLNREMAEEIAGCESVSLHIRRGDYLDPVNAAMFGNICTDDYYRGAIDTLKEMVPGARFYVFSDDASYVTSRFNGEKYRIVDINHGRDSFYDMWLMSCCKHNICANSTFSFWGARLNGNENKVMIRPTIHKKEQVFVKEEMEELWPGWSFMDPQGKLQ